MDVFTSLLHDLGNASGWVVALALAILNVYGFWKGWWVPGSIYQREVERGDKLEADNREKDRVAASAAGMAEALRQLASLGRLNESH